MVASPMNTLVNTSGRTIIPVIKIVAPTTTLRSVPASIIRTLARSVNLTLCNINPIAILLIVPPRTAPVAIRLPSRAKRTEETAIALIVIITNCDSEMFFRVIGVYDAVDIIQMVRFKSCT